LSRRGVIAAAGIGAMACRPSPAPDAAGAARPPSTTPTPPRDFSPRGAPRLFQRPDVLTVDPSFVAAQPNASIMRLWTARCGRGPAWKLTRALSPVEPTSQQRQLRWLEDDGRVSGSYLTATATASTSRPAALVQHLTRRVERYELDGSISVLADSYQGKRLNSPNDVVAHPDGSYWFTDPPYGRPALRGRTDAAGGAAMRRAS